jgi:hypothetical protein
MWNRNKIIFVIGFCLLILAQLKGVALSKSVPFTTIDKGDISYFNYGDPAFLGGDMVIKDERTWNWFWIRHKNSGPLLIPPPPVPKIDFDREMVLAVMLGYQTSGGGPAIEISSIEILWEIGLDKEYMNGINVFVKENREQGALTLITNPYHIVALKKLISVVFQHQPMGPSCINNVQCQEKEYCQKNPGDCDGSGSCNAKPEICAYIYAPVCGCDGKTYGNECVAAAEGISVLYQGECEQQCVGSGGQLSTAMCCKSAGDFPNTCAFGACGCSPENSHQVNICDCGPEKCFDGMRCVSLK